MSPTQPIAQPAYVLHSRAYRESSALVDFLTPVSYTHLTLPTKA